MSNLARYLPHNVQDFDNRIRALIVKHVGTTGGNPTQSWVNAAHEIFQEGFGEGFAAGRLTPVPKKPGPFSVQIPPEETVRATPKRIAPRDDDIEG